MNLSKIPIEELLKDKMDSEGDVVLCRIALELGIMTYSGGDVEKRIEVNRLIIKTIDEELERRQAL